MTRRPTSCDFRRRGGLTPEQLRIAFQELAANGEAKRTVAEVATLCGLSRGHFIRAFRMSVGETPCRWSRLLRIEAAQAALLNSDATIADIAAQCGFADQSHLTRVFSAEVGVSPAALRRTLRTRLTNTWAKQELL
ncbi:helix-turn-helix transcriptional regulator [Chelatococcus sambhunathii]|uniref:Helix-turn-helix transcriptional regulator n=1 Tax=Chelatococcus sambhunathii TaxID=363953 RepID=A0ABU1DHP1_9HYPH|nr:helix-turn-helix transcriptional regulator [Chelatococcus sambhunathii]